MKKYLVAVTFIDKGYIVFYYNDFISAAGFFFNYCMTMGIETSPLKQRHTWAREERDGLTIDFEKIQPVEVGDLFELQ